MQKSKVLHQCREGKAGGRLTTTAGRTARRIAVKNLPPDDPLPPLQNALTHYLVQAKNLPHSPVYLPPLPDGWQLVTMAVLPDGSLGLLGTNVDLAGAWARVRRQETEPLAADSPERPQPVAARGIARLWRFDGTTLYDGPVDRRHERARRA